MPILNWKLIAAILGGIAFLALIVWFFFFRSSAELTPAATPQTNSFDSQSEVVIATGGGSGASAEPGEETTSPVSTDKVFKISDGPIAGATFMQSARPTTTVARFVKQQNGHVFDLAIDNPGAVSRAVSNTTIPGIADVLWEMTAIESRSVAQGAIMRYVDSNNTVKTVVLSFPTQATSTVAPIRIQFLPNGVAAVAASPDGSSLAYLVPVAGGVDGYTARADGSSPKKLFSLPLSQVTLAWPSKDTLLVTSKAAAGVAGIAFSINATSGGITPILYAPGLTTTADPLMNTVVYQSVSDSERITYAHDTASNLDTPLSFDPMPEKCVWSRLEASVVYCAVPLLVAEPNYLNWWYQGAAMAEDRIIRYNIPAQEMTLITTPGKKDGGVSSDAIDLRLSPDEKYLMFIKKGERSLWGIRLF